MLCFMLFYFMLFYFILFHTVMYIQRISALFNDCQLPLGPVFSSPRGSFLGTLSKIAHSEMKRNKQAEKVTFMHPSLRLLTKKVQISFLW